MACSQTTEPAAPSGPHIKGSERKPRKRRLLGPPVHAFTIQEFCDAHRLSRSHYYKLRKQELGPAETRLGTRVLISIEAAIRWRKKREKATAA